MYDQSDLLKDLTKIFPEFASYWQADIEEDEDPPINLHSVYTSFLPFLWKVSPTPKQWQLVANHFSAAVEAGGDRENAADTCFLEALRRKDEITRTLRPLLSKKAKSYI
ncbi:hypothetical protein [Pinirhizobacter soli]|uniref:hypothetical protein n=1 Tax=Pinirhizobacter soli TaxID=2786953 RepID=UPI00202A0F36|nr:hypothetical protein [Pinirhizobacter soli]